MSKLLQKLRERFEKRRYTPEEKKRIAFEKRAREQFLRLKEKGLGITIMSL